METAEKIKTVVKEKYAGIALQSKATNQSSCCGSGCCTVDADNIMNDDYTVVGGYVPSADLGLGCGLPTQFAMIKRGDTVVDLGSGAGNDCFVARAAAGNNGKIIGIDFTPAMISLARANAEKLGYNNVEFRQGDIEDMPLTSNRANVVVSNCVLNLAPNKHKVFSEIFRVLKPGGHFSISDIVLLGEIPQKWKAVADLYAGCISGALQQPEYLAIIEEAGFINVKLQKEKKIVLPDNILLNYLNVEETAAYKASNTAIKSITVYAEKPAKDERNCCEPDSKCC